MPTTLNVEKTNFTDNLVDCLYFSSFIGNSEYILVRYKVPNKLFRRKIRYERSHVRQCSILSEKNGKGWFNSIKNHKICLIEFNDDNKISVRVKTKLYNKLESGILGGSILDNEISHTTPRENLEPEQSNDITKRLEKIYSLWKEGILTKYEFKIAKRKV